MQKLLCLLISALSLALVFGCTDADYNDRDSEPTTPDVGLADAAQPEACSDGVTTCLDQTTIGVCAEAGANVFVAGSAVFDSQDPDEAIGKLRDLARESHLG